MKGGRNMHSESGYRAASVVNGAVSALVSMLILLAAFAIAGIYPFGGSFLLCEQNSEWYDRLSQYHAALSGTGGMMYSFADGLGGDFFGTLTEGFGNLFWLITLFYPKSALVGAVPLAMMLQSAAAGLFAYCLLERLCGEQRFVAVSFSVAYAGGSVIMLGFFAPQFMGAAVFLPLVGAGVMSLCKHGSILLLFFSSIFFLISAGQLWPCLLMFTAVFFVWGLMLFGKEGENSTRAALLIVCTGLVFAATAVMIIPPLVMSADKGSIASSVSEVDHAAFGAIISSLFPGTFISEGAAPLIYCSSITLLLIPLYFFNSELRIGERQTSGFFLLFILISMAVPSFGWLWLFASEPTEVIIGYSAVFGIMAVSMAARSLSQNPSGSVRLVLLSWLIISVALAISIVLQWGKAPIEHLIFVAAALTLFAALTLVVLSGRSVTIGFCMILLLCVCCECVLGGVFALKRADQSVGLVTVEQNTIDYNRGIWIDGTIASSENSGGASPFFRVRGADSVNYNSVGDNAMSTPQMESLMNVLGIHEGKGYTPFTDALFGVKYVVTSGENEYTYPLVGTDGVNSIYQNPAAMTIGMLSHPEITGITSLSANPFEAQNEVAAAMAGAKRQLFNNAALVGQVGIGASFNETLSGSEITRYEEQAYIRYSVVAPSDGMLYMYIGCGEPVNEMAQVNGRNIPVTLGAINQIGHFSRGETVDITITMTKERIALEGVYFASLDTLLCSAALSELSANQLLYVAAEDGHVRGTVYSTGGQTLLTSIPYQSGWKAAVDGVEVPISKAFGSLIAVPVTVGAHSVELWYEPPYFTASAVISLIALALGLIYATVVEMLRRRRDDEEMALQAQLEEEMLLEEEYAEYVEEMNAAAAYAHAAEMYQSDMYPQEVFPADPSYLPPESYYPEGYAEGIVYPNYAEAAPQQPVYDYYPEPAEYQAYPEYSEYVDRSREEYSAEPDEYNNFVVYMSDDEGGYQ